MKPFSKISCLIIPMLFCQSLFAQSQQQLPQGEGPWVVVAHYQDKADVLALKPFYDLWEIDEKNKTVVMKVNYLVDYQELIDRGFKLEMDQKIMQQQELLKQKSLEGINTIGNFPCYRTVAETYAAMTSMNSTYADLVELVDIGDSWHKTEPGGDAGRDMQVVKITNENNGIVNKPILYAMGSIHAREYPPAELVTRFAEYLLSEYGNDADVTWLLDYHEIHLLLQGNPDGRLIAETQNSANQRKNRNENHCQGGNQQGVDMNRNFQFLWNQGDGSSGSDCSEIFRGDAAVSEPETAAINTYIQTLFPDERVDDLITAAPLTKSGVYLDIHNYAGLTLFPFGYSNGAGQAPNHNQLQTLARRMSYFTGYTPEQSNSSLGGADGASDDNAYGTLGVAAYTIELESDNGFYTECPYFENTIWPDNLPALIYAAKAARMPYTLASGPDVINLPAQISQVAVGQMISVSGTATDLRFSNINGTEATQNITGITAYLGIPSWQPGAVAINMSADDGSFNNKTEDFNGTLDTTGLTEGRYTIWFEATDAASVTGVPSAIFIDVVDPANIGTLSGVVRNLNTNELLESVTVSYDGFMNNTDVNGGYSIQTMATSNDLTAAKVGYLTQTIPAVVTTGGQTTTQNILLEPSCDVIVFNDDTESYSDINQAITAGWSLLTGAGSNDWQVEIGENHTLNGAKAFVSTDLASTADKSLVTPSMLLPENAVLSFWHKHQFEAGTDNYDGGVIEISTNGGSNWVNLGGLITQNGYNGTLDGGFGQPLGAVMAFVDSLGTFTEVKVDLSNYATQTAKLRWRMGTDSGVGGGDWVIDDVQVMAAGVCEGPSDIIFIDGFEIK